MACKTHEQIDISKLPVFIQEYIGDACFCCLVSLANSIVTFRPTIRKPKIRLVDLQKRAKKALKGE